MGLGSNVVVEDGGRRAALGTAATEGTCKPVKGKAVNKRSLVATDMIARNGIYRLGEGPGRMTANCLLALQNLGVAKPTGAHPTSIIYLYSIKLASPGFSRQIEFQ